MRCVSPHGVVLSADQSALQNDKQFATATRKAGLRSNWRHTRVCDVHAQRRGLLKSPPNNMSPGKLWEAKYKVPNQRHTFAKHGEHSQSHSYFYCWRTHRYSRSRRSFCALFTKLRANDTSFPNVIVSEYFNRDFITKRVSRSYSTCFYLSCRW